MIIALFLQLLDSFFVQFSTANPPDDVGFGGGGSSTTGGTTGAPPSMAPLMLHAHGIIQHIPASTQSTTHLQYFMAFFYYLQTLSIILPVPHMLAAMFLISALTLKKLFVDVFLLIVNLVRGSGAKA